MGSTYNQYKKAFLKKHKTKHGLLSKKVWTERNKRRTNIFCVADFETTNPDRYTTGDFLQDNQTQDSEALLTPDKNSVMFLCGFKFNIDPEIYITYENIEDFFTSVAKWCKAKSLTKIKIYFHNLKFDGSFILSYLLKHNFRQTLEKNRFGRALIGYKEFQALISGGKWFSLAFKWNDIKLEFVDSLKLNPASLRSIGESYGIYKGEADYSKFKVDKTHNYPVEWIEYLKQDVRITEAIMLNHLKHGESLKKMTIGSCAYAKIKSTISKYTPKYTIKEYKVDEMSYYGGQCNVNPSLQGKWIREKDKIRCIDAKSMYPSQMIKDLPYGRPTFNKPRGKSVKYLTVCIYKAKIKRKYKGMCILHVPTVFKNGKRYKYAMHKAVTYIENLEWGEHIYYMWEPELKFLKKIYNIEYEIQETKYYKVKPYLRDIVKKLYVNKRDCKDPIEKQYWKLIVNNLYGKTAQKPIRDSDFYGQEWRIDKDRYLVKGKKDTNLTINHYPALIINEIKKDTDKANPVFLGSYITSQARISLNSKIKDIVDKGNLFLYCDTDSVFYVEYNEMSDKELNIGEELGNWGREKFKVITDKESIIKYKADGFISLAPKQYRVVCDYVRWPVKMGSAGCDKGQMFDVLNQDYNYNLILNKSKLILGSAGFIVGSTLYNFRKYAGIIKVNKPPKEFIWKEK